MVLFARADGIHVPRMRVQHRGRAIETSRCLRRVRGHRAGIEFMSIIAYSVRDACTASAIGRSSLYKLIKSGKLRVRKHGTRSLILASDLQRYLEQLPDAASLKKRPSPNLRRSSKARPAAA